MERRKFLEDACSLCLIAGSGFLLGGLASCSSIPVYEAGLTGNKVTVPASLLADGTVHIVRPAGYAYDVALQRKPDGSILSLLLRCTHAENQVAWTGDGYYCSLHGSRYDENGVVTRGPAQRPLQHVIAEGSGAEVVLTLPA